MGESTPLHQVVDPGRLELALRVGLGTQLLRDHTYGVEIFRGCDAGLAADGDKGVDVIGSGDRADTARGIRMRREGLGKLEVLICAEN
jgi:hypothetical protein